MTITVKGNAKVMVNGKDVTEKFVECPDSEIKSYGSTIALSRDYPLNFVINGFSIKDTIIEVLRKYRIPGCLDDIEITRIAEDITETFADKMNLKQGDL